MCVCLYMWPLSDFVYVLLLSYNAYRHGGASYLTWSKIIQKGSFILKAKQILWAFPASDWFCFWRPSLLPPKIEVHTLCAVLGWAMVMHLFAFWTSSKMALPTTCCWSLWVKVLRLKDIILSVSNRCCPWRRQITWLFCWNFTVLSPAFKRNDRLWLQTQQWLKLQLTLHSRAFVIVLSNAQTMRGLVVTLMRAFSWNASVAEQRAPA